MGEAPPPKPTGPQLQREIIESNLSAEKARIRKVVNFFKDRFNRPDLNDLQYQVVSHRDSEIEYGDDEYRIRLRRDRLITGSIEPSDAVEEATHMVHAHINPQMKEKNFQLAQKVRDSSGKTKERAFARHFHHKNRIEFVTKLAAMVYLDQEEPEALPKYIEFNRNIPYLPGLLGNVNSVRGAKLAVHVFEKNHGEDINSLITATPEQIEAYVEENVDPSSLEEINLKSEQVIIETARNKVTLGIANEKKFHRLRKKFLGF